MVGRGGSVSSAALGGGQSSGSPPLACRTQDSLPSPGHPPGGTVLPHQTGCGKGPPGVVRER